jgi:hypothetical protein
MGANQQTSVPAFTAGQVLTAQQQTEINTGIPVFADSTARTAAFGGTGEKVLAEGQYSYLEDTNSTEVYDGSSWVSVGTEPGLVLVSATTIGSAVSSITVTGAFSATYDAYKIIITGGTSTNNTNLNLQLGAVTAGYRNQLLYASYNNTPLALGSTGGSNFTNVGAGNSSRLTMSVDVLNPYLAKPTTVGPCSNAGTGDAGVFMGYLDGTDQFTAFTVIVQTGTATGGEIRVYGYKN